MKTGRLLAAAVILAVLGGTLYWSNHRKPAEDTTAASTSATPKIISLKPDEISKLEIKKRGGDDVILARVGATDWKITSPKPLIADREPISTILSDLSPLQADQVIEEKAGDLKAYGLADPAVQISATAKDGKTQKLLVGDDTPAGGGA